MNARVLIMDDASQPFADLIAAEMTDHWLENHQPEDTGTGFMEFFDWLAGTSKNELAVLANMHPLDVADLSAADHYKLALRVWSEM